MSEELAAALYDSITNEHHDFLIHCLRIPDEYPPALAGLEVIGEEVWLHVVRSSLRNGNNEDDEVETYPRSIKWVQDVLDLAERGEKIIWE